MLRTNLASRPFYNERAIRISLGMVVVLVAAFTAFNAAQIVSLNSRNSELVSRAESAEARATDLRNQARATRQTLDKEEVGAVQAASREANLLIERRAFSWTDLFNRFEETLPADVRIAAVQPQLDENGRMLVAVTVMYRSIEDLTTFADRLEETGTFRDVLSRQSEALDDGTQRAVIQGYYDPQQARPAGVPPATSDSDGAGNRTGNAPAAVPVAPGADR
jgi:hypothetical protein